MLLIHIRCEAVMRSSTSSDNCAKFQFDILHLVRELNNPATFRQDSVRVPDFSFLVQVVALSSVLVHRNFDTKLTEARSSAISASSLSIHVCVIRASLD